MEAGSGLLIFIPEFIPNLESPGSEPPGGDAIYTGTIPVTRVTFPV